MKPRRLAVLLLTAAAASCASSYQLVPMPDQDVPLQNEEWCRIYVMRDSQMRGELHSMRIYEGRQEIGVLESGAYLCWERPPGRTLLRCVYEGPEIDGGAIEGLTDLPVTAGEVAYCAIGLSDVGKPEPKLLEPAAGLALLADRDPAKVK